MSLADFIVVYAHQGIFPVAALSLWRRYTFPFSPPEQRVLCFSNPSMDSNNSGSVVPYGTDPFDSPLLQHFLQEDPAFVYAFNDALPQQQQQNDPFGLLQGNNVSLSNLVIQDQPMLGNNNFPIGGGLGNFEPSPFIMKGKEPFFQGQFPHANNNIFNGRVGNFEPAPPRHQNQSLAPQKFPDVVTLLDWPLSPKPFFCSCCQVLRQIVHTNGAQFEKLEIHGSIGVFNHAIIEIQNITQDVPSNNGYQMIDLCNKSAAEIKKFIEGYCDQQNQFGYIIMEDPLSAYYEAISVGMGWTDELSDEDDDMIPLAMFVENDTEQDPEPEPEPENGSSSTSKPNLSDQVIVFVFLTSAAFASRVYVSSVFCFQFCCIAQRKRIPNMTLNDLSGVLHIPIKAAAKELGVCPTVVKKICRKSDLKRWPQRKVNSIVKRVAVLRKALDSPDPGIWTRTRKEIERLQQLWWNCPNWNRNAPIPRIVDLKCFGGNDSSVFALMKISQSLAKVKEDTAIFASSLSDY
ncbi:Protein NLP9, partial [Mucuna pruriens]